MKDKRNDNQTNIPDSSQLLKYIKNKSTDAEKEELERWLMAEEENSRIGSRFGLIYYACRNYFRISSWDTDKGYEQVRKKINKRRNARRLKMFSLGISVAACILLFILYIKDKAVLSERETQEIRIEANAGLRTSVNLPDGTWVYLNSGTVITYELPFYEERKIRVVGEAFFRVKENKEKVFIVTSPEGDFDVRVTGTEFNVQAFEDDYIKTVTLVSGKVELGFNTNGKTYYTILNPSDKAIMNTKDGKMEIRQVQVGSEIAWKDGRIVFKETPLPEVLKRLSYFYNVKFDVKDDIINTYSFTGTFDNRQLVQVMDYLKISSNINFRIVPSTEDDRDGRKYSTVVLWK